MARSRVYDRRKILEQAEQAQRRGQTRKAIRLYRWVLGVEHNNPQLHARLAPLLARNGEHFDAWVSYRRCAETALREKREERALALYRDATRALPHEVEAWQTLAHLLVRRGDSREALAVLLEGSKGFKKRHQQAAAIYLLRRARAIDPWQADCVLALVRRLARNAQREEALILLEGLAGRTTGTELRRVRAAQVRIDGSVGACWRWLRCVATGGAPQTSAAAPSFHVGTGL